MRVCPLCGEENLDSAESCKECGTYLGPVEVHPEPPAVFPERDLDLPDWLRELVEPEDTGEAGQVTEIAEPAKPDQPVQSASAAVVPEHELDLPDWLREVDKPDEPENTGEAGQVTEIAETAKPVQPLQSASAAVVPEHELDLPDWLRDLDKPVEPEETVEPVQVTEIAEPAKPVQPVQSAPPAVVPERELDLPDWLREVAKPDEPEITGESGQVTEIAAPSEPVKSAALDDLDESAEPADMAELFEQAEQIRQDRLAAAAAPKPETAESKPPEALPPAAAVLPQEQPTAQDIAPVQALPAPPAEEPASVQPPPARRKPSAPPTRQPSAAQPQTTAQPAKPKPTTSGGQASAPEVHRSAAKPEQAAQPVKLPPAAAHPPAPTVKPQAASPVVRRAVPAAKKKANPVGWAVALVGLVILILLVRSLVNAEEPPAVSAGTSTLEQVATLPVTILTPKISATSQSSSELPTLLPAETASVLPVKKSINGQDGAILIEVPAGEFWMGLTEIQANVLSGLCPSCDAAIQSAMPVRQVVVSGFWIYQTEVTNAMYRRCEIDEACSPPGSLGSAAQNKYYRNLDFNHYPVLQVTWEDAEAYCRWAGGRLPYEAEWEKAARGGEARLFPWGNSVSAEKMANTDNILGDTAQVGSYLQDQSPYGVLDMAGNVSEWVYDWYAADTYTTSQNADPTGPTSSPLDLKVVRGASWADAGVRASSALRGYLDPDKASYTLGFRCAIPLQDSTASAKPEPTNSSAAPTPAASSTSAATLAAASAPNPTSAPSAVVSVEPQGKIVYTCQLARQEYQNQICLMNADGSGMQVLTPDDSFDSLYASLAPDGRSVVFSSNSSGRYEIYEYNLSKGSLSRVTSGGIFYAPEISPDGSQIVATRETSSGEGIWVMDRDGDNLTAVYNPSSQSCVDPTWSPDGKQILFACGASGSTQRQLYIINQDGSGLRQVTWAADLRGRSDWSPDGKTLATYLGQTWMREVYLLNLDGSDLRMIGQPGGNSQAPSFSPDGNWIAFTSYLDRYGDNDGCEIYIMRTDGSDVRRLTNNTYCDWQPRWGP
ncbi:MAG: SUMF1/EgtB/PvdO family nonheme iron enzyme [Anaerolineales bacterium]|jgi:formylglycine-generating enzyme required for sulfatase activity/Tol biopolymer transport system component|nr:SUMF1/EgtB/PvdO family nonheme iron enzyme [Anaerolineales bacterium]